jgi:hypothetical protein
MTSETATLESVFNVWCRFGSPEGVTENVNGGHYMTIGHVIPVPTYINYWRDVKKYLSPRSRQRRTRPVFATGRKQPARCVSFTTTRAAEAIRFTSSEGSAFRASLSRPKTQGSHEEGAINLNYLYLLIILFIPPFPPSEPLGKAPRRLRSGMPNARSFAKYSLPLSHA